MVVISRFDIYSLVQDYMSLATLVVCNNLPLHILSFIFRRERDQDEAKTSSSLSDTIPHHDTFVYFTKSDKVILKIFLHGCICQTTDKELDLILLSWLMKRLRVVQASTTLVEVGKRRVLIVLKSQRVGKVLTRWHLSLISKQIIVPHLLHAQLPTTQCQQHL